MLGDIDKSLPQYDYELTLHRPNANRETIAYLTSAYGIKYSPKFANIDELEFLIPYKVAIHHRFSLNSHFDKCDGDMFVKLNSPLGEQYFVITLPEKKGNDKDIKYIKAYSLEWLLSKKVFSDYKADSRLLYDPLNTVDTDGVQNGVINLIETLTPWTFDKISIPSGLLTKYRSFDVSETTVLDFMYDIQKTYDCIFEYDTVNMIIYVKELADMSMNKGFYLSQDKYLKEIIESANHEEIVTRLRIKANLKDGQLVNSLFPTGTDYIENFNFYKQPKYMDADLISALNTYEAKVATKTTEYQGLVTQQSTLLGTLGTKKDELTEIQSKISANQALRDANLGVSYSSKTTLTTVASIVLQEPGTSVIKVANPSKITSGMKVNFYNTVTHTFYSNNGESYTLLKSPENNITINPSFDSVATNLAIVDIVSSAYDTYIDLKSLEASQNISISLTEDELETVANSITAIQTALDKSNTDNFSVTQLKTLDNFVKEKVWDFTDIVNSDDLLIEASKVLNRYCQPQIRYSTDIISFLSSVECSRDWKKLCLGDIINLEYDKFGINIEMRLVGYTHDLDNSKLTLELSNRNRYYDDDIWLQDWLKPTFTSSTQVQYNKLEWDKAKETNTAFQNYKNGILDASVQYVVGGHDQLVRFDDRGIFVIDKLDQNKQIALLSGAIVLTTDGFESTKTAILPDRIVSEMLVGDILLAQQVRIVNNDSSVIIDNNGITLDSGKFEITGGTNGISLSPTDGFLITRSDNRAKVSLNATDGFAYSTSPNGTLWNKMFYYEFDPESDDYGNIVLKGIIKAADFQDLGGNSLFTIDKSKITGTMIECVGLEAKNGLGQTYFRIGDNSVELLGSTLSITGGLDENNIPSSDKWNTGAINAGEAMTKATETFANIQDIFSDNKVTPDEKKRLKTQYDTILGDKILLEAQANNYGIGTELTAYINKYNTLKTYLDGLLASMSTTSDVVRNTMNINMSGYYNTQLDLIGAINTKINTTAAAAKAKADAIANAENKIVAEVLGRVNPTTPADTSSSGLKFGSNYMGYWNGTKWKNYLGGDGKFLFEGDANNLIAWDGAALNIKGNITMIGGSISWASVTKPTYNAGEVGAKPSSYVPDWSEVTGKPTIPTIPSYITSTKITQTTIESPSVTGGTLTGSSIIGTGTLGIGSLTWASCPFRVDASGNLTANNANLTSATVSGILTASQLIINGTNVINAQNKIDGQYINNITADYVKANVSISSPTITGGTFKTASSGSRVELSSSGLIQYDGSGITRLSISSASNYSAVQLFTSSGSSCGYLSGDSSGNVLVTSNAYVILSGTEIKSLSPARFFSDIGFFSTVPQSKQFVTNPTNIVTTETSPATYTSTAQTMLTNLKTDVTNIKNTLSDLMTSLKTYGLIGG